MKIMVDSEYLDKLKKNLGFKEDGSLEVGKNLEVDGTTKMNGGFEPIHEYETQLTYQGEKRPLKLKVYFEKDLQTIGDTYTFIGEFSFDGVSEDSTLCFGQYRLNQGKIKVLRAFHYNDGGVLSSFYCDTESDVYYNNMILTNDSDDVQTALGENLKTLFGNQSLVGEGNIDLYRHKLDVQGANGTNASWVYYTSSSNLKCDSVQDLRTLLKVGDIPVWAPGNLATGTFAPIYLYVSSSSCVIKTSETESTPVISVSDKVTTI